MRIIVSLFPTNKYGTKKEYTELRKFLLKDGYQMVAPEIFMRITTNRKAADKHIRRIQEMAPSTGKVRLIKMTEKQFSNIMYISGEPDFQEQMVGSNCHIII